MIAVVGIISINDRPTAVAAATKPDLESRIDALIKGYEKEREENRKAHRKNVEELGSYIVNLLVELRTNNVAIDRWPISTNWQLNIMQAPGNTNRMVVRYTE